MPPHHCFAEGVPLFEPLAVEDALDQPAETDFVDALVSDDGTPEYAQEETPLIVVELAEDEHLAGSESLLS